MLGVAENKLPALSFDDLVDPEHAEAARQRFLDMTTGIATSVQLEVMLRSAAPQTVWGHMVLSAVTDESGPRYVIVMIEDISEQKRLAEMYRQSQKLEAVGRLAGGVAHDFNNLLTTINGISDLMLSEIDPNSPFHDDLRQILDAGRRAAGLTRQLLAFGRKQVLKPALIDVNAVLVEMGGLIPRVVGEDVRCTFKPQPGLPAAKVDKTQLEQVIMNLVVNARDAMPSGGSVLIETHVAHINGHQAQAYGTTAGEYVKISVTDTGIGMDQATRDRAFEPFFTTKPLGKGTGLGLATVYGIVKQSGGGILVDSEPGAGTTFHIAFPAQHDVADATPDEPEPAVDSGAEVVLVVEDEDTVRALFVRVLRRAGYDVLEARNGLEALVMSEEHSGEIDIMVTDVIMPGMNGPEAVKRLLRRRPRMKVLYISGYTEDIVLQQDAGKTLNHLQKPVSPATLCLAVRHVLDEARELLPREELVKLVV
jgi:PAS domain S-box-containing protein